MTYELPTDQFNALEHAKNRVLTANQFRDHIVEKYKSGYEGMWQTPLTHGDDALTMEQMQSVLNTAQATFAAILTDSAAFVQFVADTYPEALEGDEPLLPERFLSSPYNLTIGESGITLLSLKDAWLAPEEPEEGGE